MRKIGYLLALSTFIIAIGCKQSKTGKKVQTLHQQWTFQQAGEDNWMEAKVPGVVHMDLFRNGEIEEPFDGLNEKDQQWIGKTDWTYKTTFKVDKALLFKPNIDLIFEGLDTYADVYLNDEKILSANNMFREWRKPVKDLILNGENTLVVKFRSAFNEALPKFEASAYQLPANNDQADKKVSVYVRKAPYHFGWDWGPRFVTCGVWRPVRLEAWDDAHINNVHVQQEALTDESATLSAKFNIQAASSGQFDLEVHSDGTLLNTQSIEVVEGKNTQHVPFTIDDPERWWPAGMGDQKLYDLTFKLVKGNREMDAVTERIGLRNIEFVHEPDSAGKSFYFKVNGHPVFMKGANYIPSDNFLTRVDSQRYEYLIQSTVDASMNMLRVWGGGIYEDELFYDLCDEKGVLVWQDFMFACSMYPNDTTFYENVKQEAIDNIIRLRNHPSIAIWCGNNEIETAWNDWGWQRKFGYSKEDSIEIKEAYDKIFNDILPEQVAKYDPERAYTSSSPSANSDSLTANRIGNGDMHYWGVWHGAEPYESFDVNISRFMSEYGMQSFPVLKSVKKYTEQDDWDIESEVMLAHQRHPRGNQLIRTYMEREYGVPRDFEDFLYMSQVQQAEIIKYAVETHRQSMPYCMGSLYWQLNDCWPVASWSGIDYYGKWKAMHQYAREFFQPVLPVIKSFDGEVQIFGVSDMLSDEALTLDIQLMDFNGEVLFDHTEEIQLPANNSTLLKAFDENALLKNASSNNVALVVQLKAGDGVVSRNIHLFDRFKRLELPAHDVEYKYSDGTLTVSSESLHWGVYVDLTDVELNLRPNFFTILPGESVEIELNAEESIAEELVNDNLKIKSVNEVLDKMTSEHRVQ